MTATQLSQARGSLFWNLVNWLKRRQAAKREGNQFSVDYCQEWIDDTRARIARLNGMASDVEAKVQVGA